jgi:hypothetical protein
MICPKSCKKVTSSLPVVQNLRNVSWLANVEFTQNHLQWPCLYPRKPAHTIKLGRLKHGRAFGHVESLQKRCAWAKTLSILTVDTTEKKRMKKRLSTVF